MADFAKGLCGGRCPPGPKGCLAAEAREIALRLPYCVRAARHKRRRQGWGHLGRDRPCRRARSGRQGAQVPCAPVPATDPRPQPLTHLPTCLPLSHRLCLPTVIGRRAHPVQSRRAAVRSGRQHPRGVVFRPPAGRPGRAAHSRGPKRFRCSFHRPSLRPVFLRNLQMNTSMIFSSGSSIPP